MTVGELREAPVSRVTASGGSSRGRAALWLAFAIVHGALVWLNLTARGYPLGDVTGGLPGLGRERRRRVRAHGHRRAVGLPDPRLRARWPASLAFGSEWYAADLARDRRTARRGGLRDPPRRPAALPHDAGSRRGGGSGSSRCSVRSRSDASTRSPCRSRITGLLWAAGRPRLAGVAPDDRRVGQGMAGGPPHGARDRVAQTLGCRDRRRHAQHRHPRRQPGRGIAGLNAFGFVAEQAGRGLQIEAPLAVGWLWQIVGGSTAVEIGTTAEILTYQISGPGADAAAASTTPLMAVGVAVVLLLGVRAVRRGAAFGRLLPPLALSFVVVLMLANKVGLTAVRDVARSADHPRTHPAAAPFPVPAVLAAAVALSHARALPLPLRLAARGASGVRAAAHRQGRAARRAVRVGHPGGVAGWRHPTPKRPRTGRLNGHPTSSLARSPEMPGLRGRTSSTRTRRCGRPAPRA